MREQQSGKIVNIASVAGRIGAGGIAHYSASKAAAINVSQAYAIRLAPSNINVNAVCPGLLWTDLWEKLAVRRKVMRPNERELSGREVFLEPDCRDDPHEQGANAGGHRQGDGVPRL